MNTVEIIGIRAANFRCDQDSRTEYDGRNAIWTSKNGLGKSTKADEFCWLLTGKALDGSTIGETCKPLDTNNEPIHRLVTEVEAWLLVNGNPLVLKRSLQEKWTRPKQQEEWVLTTHETTTTVNGEELAIGKYNAYLEAICPLDRWLILTNPMLFAAQDKTAIRSVLLEISGNASFDDVVRTDKKYEPLREALTSLGRTPERQKKVFEDARKAAQDEMEALPKIISAHREHIKEIPAWNWPDLVKMREQRVRDLRASAAEITAGGAVAALRVKVAGYESEMTTIANTYRLSGDPSREKALAEVRKLSEQYESEAMALRSKKTKLSADEQILADFQKRLARNDTEMDEVEARQEAIKAEKFVYVEFKAEDMCPSCGNPLREDQIQEVRDKFEVSKETALVAFNGSRARRIEAEDRAWENLNTERAKIKAKIKELDGEGGIAGTLGILRAEIAEAEKALDQTKLMWDEVQSAVPAPTTADHTKDARYIELAALRLADKAKIAEHEANSQIAVDESNTEIAKAEFLLAEAKGWVAQAAANEETRAKIKAKEAREIELRDQVLEAERGVFIIDQYVKAWVGLMDDRINSRFKIVRWKLFKAQMNGGIASVCEALYAPTGAPPSAGQKVAIGLEVVRVLQEFYGFRTAVWIDEAEGYTGTYDMPCQTIRLFAKEDADTLQVTFLDKPDPFAEPRKSIFEGTRMPDPYETFAPDLTTEEITGTPNLVPAGTTFGTDTDQTPNADDFALAPTTPAVNKPKRRN